jgi:hypothetical protein
VHEFDNTFSFLCRSFKPLVSVNGVFLSFDKYVDIWNRFMLFFIAFTDCQSIWRNMTIVSVFEEMIKNVIEVFIWKHVEGST